MCGVVVAGDGAGLQPFVVRGMFSWGFAPGWYGMRLWRFLCVGWSGCGYGGNTGVSPLRAARCGRDDVLFGCAESGWCRRRRSWLEGGGGGWRSEGRAEVAGGFVVGCFGDGVAAFGFEEEQGEDEDDSQDDAGGDDYGEKRGVAGVAAFLWSRFEGGVSHAG